MIPISLSLKNFLSYGPILQTIQFEPYSLICLSGKNGHGKSALLDAMTWAIWGQARKMAGAARADESLLRYSEHEMCVIFEFISNGDCYRIRREFSRSGSKGVATLDFGLIEKESKKTIALTEKTIRETQAKIERIVGLDFETFINSAFLRQGNSNEFSKKSPRERKEVLAKILSLDQYEMIKKRALEKVKTASLEQESVKVAQEKRATEKMELGDIDKLLNLLCSELNKIVQEEELLKQQQVHQQYIIGEVRGQIVLYQSDSVKKRQLLEEKKQFSAQLSALRIEWQSNINALMQSAKIEPLLQKKQEVLNTVLLQKDLLKTKISLQEQLTRCKEKQHEIVRNYELKNNILHEQYIIERESLKGMLEADQATINEIIAMLPKIEVELEKNQANLLIYQEKLVALTGKKSEYIFFIQLAEKRSRLCDKILSKKAYYETILHDIEQKHNLLCNDQQCAICPICDQTLSIEKKHQLSQSMENQKVEMTEVISRLTLLLSRLRPYTALLKEYKEQESKINRELELVRIEQSECGIKRVQLEEKTEQLKNQLAQLRERMHSIIEKGKELHNQFISKRFILNNDAEYINITSEIDSLGMLLKSNLYDDQCYAAACKALQEIEEYISNNDEQKIKQNMAVLKERIRTICLFIKKNNQEQSKCYFVQDKLQALEQKAIVLAEKENALKTGLGLLQQKKEELLHQKGILEMRQRVAQSIAEVYAKDELRINILQKEIDHHLMIANIMGKDGIQALLIEQAVPEIEYEANALLSRLTNNQMQLFIESIKDLKSGKIKETLDIKISDAEGVRSYDLFSGGEAFRIDLALRIGISKLLASRAGTTLETLIIDEGFGSQDEEGIALVMESLYKIQGDFKKIIIVSHLAAVKEHIPVHFVVSKGVGGTTVQVLEG